MGEIARRQSLARPALSGEIKESVEARRERMLGQRLSVLSDDDQQVARDAINSLMNKIADPKTAGYIMGELVWATLENIRDKEDFDRRMKQYEEELVEKKTTMGGHPIFKPEQPALPE